MDVLGDGVAMDPKFEAGDVVSLKAGGPPMTVTGVVKGSGKYGYKTSWSVDGEAQVGAFPEDVLDPARQ